MLLGLINHVMSPLFSLTFIVEDAGHRFAPAPAPAPEILAAHPSPGAKPASVDSTLTAQPVSLQQSLLAQTVHVPNASPTAIAQDNLHTHDQSIAGDESGTIQDLPPPLYARCGFAEDDTKGWRDFRVTPLVKLALILSSSS